MSLHDSVVEYSGLTRRLHAGHVGRPRLGIHPAVGVVSDIVAEGTAILPGDEELISALSIANPDAKRWFWGMWGLNHCFLSILKLQAINQR